VNKLINAFGEQLETQHREEIAVDRLLLTTNYWIYADNPLSISTFATMEVRVFNS
jgi:hypothetical protein